MQIGSPNLTYKKWSTISPGNPFILGVKRSKVKVTSHRSRLCTPVSAGFFLFDHLVFLFDHTVIVTIRQLNQLYKERKHTLHVFQDTQATK